MFSSQIEGQILMRTCETSFFKFRKNTIFYDPDEKTHRPELVRNGLKTVFFAFQRVYRSPKHYKTTTNTKKTVLKPVRNTLSTFFIIFHNFDLELFRSHVARHPKKVVLQFRKAPIFLENIKSLKIKLDYDF